MFLYFCMCISSYKILIIIFYTPRNLPFILLLMTKADHQHSKRIPQIIATARTMRNNERATSNATW